MVMITYDDDDDDDDDDDYYDGDDVDDDDDECIPSGLAGSQAAMQALQYQLAAAASLGKIIIIIIIFIIIIIIMTMIIIIIMTMIMMTMTTLMCVCVRAGEGVFLKNPITITYPDAKIPDLQFLFCVAVSLVVLLLISSSTYSFSRNNYTMNEISLFLVHI